MKFKQLLASALIFALCGAPEVIRAQQQSAPSSTPARPGAAQTQARADSPQTSSQQPETPGPVNGVTVDPSRGPLQPAPSESQPPAEQAAQPNATQSQQQNAQPQAQSLPEGPAPQTPTEPVGAAAAQPGRTAGGAASKPAGTAIAPAKQRQMRSWLIRVGAIAAAGAAFGTVYALSRRTPSTPPGTQTLGAH